MSESIYKFIELVGTSEKSWEDAVASVVKKASETLRDLRIAEVLTLDAKIEKGNILLYRAKVKLSFKFQNE
ncbi:MAG: transporter [Candidatus Lokiarchaeota archaeon]|nr:transporter [Candidatus Lokiarchaeota archaeon]